MLRLGRAELKGRISEVEEVIDAGEPAGWYTVPTAPINPMSTCRSRWHSRRVAEGRRARHEHQRGNHADGSARGHKRTAEPS